MLLWGRGNPPIGLFGWIQNHREGLLRLRSGSDFETEGKLQTSVPSRVGRLSHLAGTGTDDVGWSTQGASTGASGIRPHSAHEPS